MEGLAKGLRDFVYGFLDDVEGVVAVAEEGHPLVEIYARLMEKADEFAIMLRAASESFFLGLTAAEEAKNEQEVSELIDRFVPGLAVTTFNFLHGTLNRFVDTYNKCTDAFLKHLQGEKPIDETYAFFEELGNLSLLLRNSIIILKMLYDVSKFDEAARKVTEATAKMLLEDKETIQENKKVLHGIIEANIDKVPEDLYKVFLGDESDGESTEE